jgi:hypothetical protein
MLVIHTPGLRAPTGVGFGQPCPYRSDAHDLPQQRRLSQTCPTCVAGATGLGELLDEASALHLQTLVVWMPVIKTDVAAPTSAKLALIRGSRVQQFWDPKHFISRELLALARAHLDRLSPDTREMLEGATVAWDVVALFPAGARWEAEPPWPGVWGFPIVDSLDQIRDQLAASGSADDNTRPAGVLQR